MEDLTRDELTAASVLFADADPAALVSPRGSADARDAFGGTGRGAVEGQLDRARRRLLSRLED